MASLTSLLPAPTQQVWDRDDELKAMRVGSALVVSQTSVPPYGQRKGWVPRAEEDFGARGKESTSNALAVQLDETGKVKYSAIARQGHGADKIIYSKLTDLLPSEVLAEEDPSLQKPSEDDIQDITEKTKLALEKLTNAKISAALPVKAAPKAINKKIPRAAPSPPAPVLHSPPRRVSVKQQRDWKLAEALYIADRKAREAVEARAQLERRLAQREKEKKEEHLRVLAQRARDHRAGYGDDEAYNVYDKPWRNQDTVGAHIYRPTRNKDKDNYGGDLETIANTRRYVCVCVSGYGGDLETIANTRRLPRCLTMVFV
ncbi:hypothetical protein MSG28_015757 [Choristoneura fumiferana]|uniref:Uncharacterized protein n=1 Tax=Choristoneura fumiferana TaxID=7141 RepID=A0ACC0KBD4_CHOFU|nr:hypothetical protein MSG28_015757 [Choristoneura fumiferana]